MIRIIIWVLSAAFLPLQHSYAQVPEMDWKDVKMEHLKMKSYDADTNASAVVLFDKGHVVFDDEQNLVLDAHVRIKILDKDGLDYADVQLGFNQAAGQSIDKIKGFTYNLNSGKENRERLRKRDIFEDKISKDIKVYKFTLPKVKEGSIIEYKYTKVVGGPREIPDWSFQWDIPVKWSVYTAAIPAWYQYTQYLQGGKKLYIYDREVNRQMLMIDSEYGMLSGVTNVLKYKWIMKDVPALEKQPFVSTIENYRCKLFLQLSAVVFPNQDVKELLLTWDQLADEIRKNMEDWGTISEDDSLYQFSHQLTDSIADTTQKIEALYSEVAKHFKWNGQLRTGTSRSLESIWETSTGSGIEINLVLMQMLREVGITANPVFISTRSHGKIQDFAPITQQFNHMICAAEHQGKLYLLDAKEPKRTMDLLAIQDLNGKGFLISDEDNQWVQLENKMTTKTITLLTGKLDTDGKIHGMVQQVSNGYEALDRRTYIEEEGLDSYAEEYIFDQLLDLNVDSIKAENEEDYKEDLSTATYFSAKADVKKMADMMYFNPTLLIKRSDNPFKQPTRKYPIEYSHQFDQEFTLSITLPQEYEIVDLPESKTITLPDSGGTFNWRIQAFGNRLMMRNIWKINRRTFSVEEYEGLKSLYTQMIQSHSEPVVLKKAVPSTKNVAVD